MIKAHCRLTLAFGAGAPWRGGRSDRRERQQALVRLLKIDYRIILFHELLLIFHDSNKAQKKDIILIMINGNVIQSNSPFSLSEKKTGNACVCGLVAEIGSVPTAMSMKIPPSTQHQIRIPRHCSMRANLWMFIFFTSLTPGFGAGARQRAGRSDRRERQQPIVRSDLA